VAVEPLSEDGEVTTPPLGFPGECYAGHRWHVIVGIGAAAADDELENIACTSGVGLVVPTG
jgi:hypothetical protein